MTDLYTELGSGTYGCAVQQARKALMCDVTAKTSTPTSTKSGTPIPHTFPHKFQHFETLSKLFIRRADWEEEIDQFSRIAKIDPQFKWSLPMIASCKTRPLKETICKKMGKGPLEEGNSYYQIQMPKIGVSLYHVMRQSPLTPSEIFLVLRTLLTAITDMKKHKFAHMDLKPTNILYYQEKKQAVLIDYGMSGPVSVLKDRDAADVYINNNYIYWGPELRMYGFITEYGRGIPFRKMLPIILKRRWKSSNLMKRDYVRVLEHAYKGLEPLYNQLTVSPLKMYSLLAPYFAEMDTYSVGIILMEMLGGRGLKKLTAQDYVDMDLEHPELHKPVQGASPSTFTPTGSSSLLKQAKSDPNEETFMYLNVLAFKMAHPNPAIRIKVEEALEFLDVIEHHHLKETQEVPNKKHTSRSKKVLSL